jgi:CBS-domain-containing membrane protein
MHDVAPSALAQSAAPPRGSRAPGFTLRGGIVACAGVFCVIAALAISSFNLGLLLLLGSFGSTAVMMFTFPELHFSQPRSVIGGHVICTAVGLAALAWFGPTWWSLASAAGLSAALMMATRTMHPPAGSNPVIVFLAAPGWGFVLFPTLFGAAAMVFVAVLYHRATKRVYPAYWY